MKKIFRVEVWIDDKHFHTLQGEVSHVRNRRLALTQIFRNILRQLYTHGHLPPHTKSSAPYAPCVPSSIVWRAISRQKVAKKKGKEL